MIAAFYLINYQVHVGYFRISAVLLTLTTGSLTCVRDSSYACVYTLACRLHATVFVCFFLCFFLSFFVSLLVCLFVCLFVCLSFVSWTVSVYVCLLFACLSITKTPGGQSP